jgi:succinoglycan biosynthesis protein ExoM
MADAVTVAICTFKRAEGLRRTLQGLWAQQGLTGTRLHALVVDNDAQASARQVAEASPAPLPWSLRYVVEPSPGLAAVRNRCLAETTTELVAFIDDDEVPAPGWLAALLRCHAQTAADAVFGCVVPAFEAPLPTWAGDGALFAKPRRPTGSTIGWEATNTANVLLGRRLLELAGGAFDERFAASGGEDTLLFYRAERHGARLVWCDDAVVHEHLPAGRLRLAWLLRRAFRGGQTWVRVRVDAQPRAWLPLALRGAVGALIAAALTVPSLAVSRAAAVRQACRLVGGLGKATAWWAERAARRAQARHYVG